MDLYCRVCSTSEAIMLQSLFEICESEDEVIANMIIDCTDVMVTDGDGLPQNICTECLIKVKDAYQLRKRCIHSNAIFKKMLVSTTIQSAKPLSSSIRSKQMDSDQTLKLDGNSAVQIELNQLYLCQDCGVLLDTNEAMLEHVRVTHIAHKTKEKLVVEYFEESEEQEIEYLDEVGDETKNLLSEHNVLSSQITDPLDCEVVENAADNGSLKNHHGIWFKSSTACCVTRCYKKFKKHEDLQRHAMTTHELLRIQHAQERKHHNLVCDICLKGFANEPLFIRHRTADRHQKHVCLSCGSRYVSKSNLIQHEKSQCGKVATFCCPQCDKRFFTSGGLKNHEKLHSIKKPNVCSQCGKSFHRKSVLKDHISMVHSNVRWFECTLCPKSFTSKTVFQSHQLTHTKERPYQCRFCNKRYLKTSDPAFIRDRERRLHERIHTRAKLYSCDDCCEGFNKFADFKQHRLQHHGKDALCNSVSTTLAAI
ncbi:zinc finger protein 883-like isoform X2 [Sabethes cyaneus]|uniref:zinc finger protein 883-like isoform X2 n=1 Tax=Sabethes cyaneus TaxID=53552 RepID=UPI00237E96D4|nr:zinc finger protein 883-like isoform X2 [Sabethes cyaneus]